MKKYLLFSAFAMISLLGFSQAKTWANDPAHSRLGFSIKHMTISEIDGRFADFSVTVTTSKADYSDAQIELTAKVASVDTDIEARDKHLRAEDFFDAEKYPTLTFKSISLKKIGDNKGQMTGDLTFHGITKKVMLDVVHFGSITNPKNKKETAGFKVTGVIKRSDFNFGSKYPEAVLSDDVQLIANLEFSPNQ